MAGLGGVAAEDRRDGLQGEGGEAQGGGHLLETGLISEGQQRGDGPDAAAEAGDARAGRGGCGGPERDL